MNYKQIAQEYMQSEEGKFWKDVFISAEEANGLCTDSAESFVKWCEQNGHEAYALDLVSHEANMGSHTIALMGDGHTTIDFTMHQFFPGFTDDFLAPYVSTLDDYVGYDWGVDGAEAYRVSSREPIPESILALKMGYIPEHDIEQEIESPRIDDSYRR